MACVKSWQNSQLSDLNIELWTVILCSDAHTTWQDSLLWCLGFWLKHPCVKFCAVTLLDDRIPYFDAWVSECLKKEDTVLRLARDDQVEKKLLKKTKTDTLCFVREFFWALSSSVLWMPMTRRRRRRRICRGGGSVLTKCTSMREDESHAIYYRSSEKISKARKARG